MTPYVNNMTGYATTPIHYNEQLTPYVNNVSGHIPPPQYTNQTYYTPMTSPYTPDNDNQFYNDPYVHRVGDQRD
jgi:hypothetical protein